MITDAAKDFKPEHLTKWLRITREYLFTPNDCPISRGWPSASGRETAELPGSAFRVKNALQLRQATSPFRDARGVRAFHPMAVMKSVCALCLFAVAAAVAAQDVAPDEQVKLISDEVISLIKQDQDIRKGNQKKLIELVDTKVVPHFDFRRMTALAVGRHWPKASAQQKDLLSGEFRTLLVRTYSSALSAYKNQIIEFKPLRAAAEDTEVTVRTQVKQSGAAPISIDYSVERTSSGWKVYDIVVGGVSLVTNYRETFNSEIRDGGVDGLIKSLASKNRSLEVQASANHGSR